MVTPVKQEVGVSALISLASRSDFQNQIEYNSRDAFVPELSLAAQLLASLTAGNAKLEHGEPPIALDSRRRAATIRPGDIGSPVILEVASTHMFAF